MTKDIGEAPYFEPAGVAYDLDPAHPALMRSQTLAGGRAVRAHRHPRGQLVWACSGVLRVICEGSVWIVPPSHTVWIPGNVEHQVVTETRADVRHLFIHPDRSVRNRDGGGHCCVLTMTPLMRELVLRLVELGDDPLRDGQRLRLGAVILDELEDLSAVPLSLPGGHDPRLVRLTRYLGDRPDDGHGLAELAAIAGTSPRTLERLFREETGLSFKTWRSRLRLLAAIERLNSGASGTEAALTVGYSSPSAFVAAFRSQFGATPQQFLRGQRALG